MVTLSQKWHLVSYVAKGTEQPVFGKYLEQIFEAPLSTQAWTWVK